MRKKLVLPASILLVLGMAAGGGFLWWGDGELQPVKKLPQITVGKIKAWQAGDQMAFAAPAHASGDRVRGPLYVKVVYLDQGRGLLKVFYTSAFGETQSENHTRSSRVDTGGFVASYHELIDPLLPGNRQGAFLNVRLSGSDGAPLTIQSVTAQQKPFEDSAFKQALNRPWARPLRFPAATGNGPPPTLKGSVMVGYQGWFRAPNDRDDDGWFHWFRSRTNPSPSLYTFDMWPDTRGYPREDRVSAGNIKTRGGQRACLFSSTSDAVVGKHFEWMRQNDIDGAFLQRFLTQRKGGDDGTPEWVLLNVRKAANSEKRLWAVEYDVSGMPPATARAALKRDWIWLRDALKVTDDPYYARENGKPVVFVWGLPFLEHGFSPETADKIVDFFKNDPIDGGNYMIGSLPNQWRQLPPEWIAHTQKCDGVQVWQSQDYLVDKQAAEQWKVDYYPHVWPGFSWAHLTRKQVPAAYTERGPGGTFYRQRIAEAFKAGCDRLFVGMFDEYDEGTAIMPMSDDPPPPGPPEGRFLTNSGDPPNRWLQITGEAKQALKESSPAQAFEKTP